MYYREFIDKLKTYITNLNLTIDTEEEERSDDEYYKKRKEINPDCYKKNIMEYYENESYGYFYDKVYELVVFKEYVDKLKYLDIELLQNIPYRVIILRILPYIECNVGEMTVKKLYGYFKLDKFRKIFPIWSCIRVYITNLQRMIEYPTLIYLDLFAHTDDILCLPYDQPLKEHEIYPPLPTYPKLRYLDLGAPMKEMMTIINLVTLNICSGCIIEKLPSLPNLEWIRLELCCELVEMAPVYPKLKYAHYNTCHNIIKMPNCPKLIKISLDRLFKLTFVPPYPRLRCMYLDACDLLTELPYFPKLIKIDSFDYRNMCVHQLNKHLVRASYENDIEYEDYESDAEYD